MSELLLFGACICALITAYILFFHTSAYARYSTNILGWIMVIFTYCNSGYLLIYSKLILDVPYLYKTFAPFNLLISPLCFLYVKSVLKDEKGIQRKDLLHFIPFVLFVINYFPFYLMPIQEKYDLVKRVTSQLSLNYETHDGILPEIVYQLTRIIQSTFYIVLQLLLIWNAYKTKSIYNRLPHAKSVLRWLMYLTILPTVAIFSILVMIIMVVNGWGTANDNSLNIPLFVLAISIFAFCIYLLVHPHVLYGFPIFAKNILQDEISIIEEISSQTDEQKLSIEDNLVTKNFASEIARLEKALKEDFIYLRPDLSVSILSVLLKIPSRDLSFIINKHYNLRFNDFVNNYRIDFVIAKMNENYLDNYTVESLFLKAGFNNKSTFNTAFKKFKNCTPSEYIKKMSNL